MWQRRVSDDDRETETGRVMMDSLGIAKAEERRKRNTRRNGR
jgi:hypothetical protein